MARTPPPAWRWRSQNTDSRAHFNKAATWALAHQFGEKSGVTGGGDVLVELIVEHTHTCYLGDWEHRHAWGYGCASCPACLLRVRGYEGWQQGL